MPAVDAWVKEREERLSARMSRAKIIKNAGGVDAAISKGDLPGSINTTVSEALILGLLLQGVKKFIVVFGHGSTEIGEVLRVYQEAGLCRVFGVRSEVEASHAAAALNWIYEKLISLLLPHACRPRPSLAEQRFLYQPSGMCARMLLPFSVEQRTNAVWSQQPIHHPI